MKKLLLLFLLIASTSITLYAQEQKSAQVDIRSQPEGAMLFIDGNKKERTPCTVDGLDPDRKYRIRLQLEGYEDSYVFESFKEGYNPPKEIELTPIKGLLLITSDPAGAKILLNGYDLGITPRLVANLNAKDIYSLVLQKDGYLDSKIEVKFESRRPLVHNVRLTSNSGTAKVTTSPSGAEVLLNGIARGMTPVTVPGIPRGGATVTVKKQGYKTVSREISINAGDEREVYIELDPLPGILNLSSVPTGARFYIDNVPVASDAIQAKVIKPGSYSVRAEMDGFDSVTRVINIGNGQTVSEEFRLVSNLGKLVITTKPSGATVEVDGKKVGVTKSAGATAEWSEALLIPNLKAGERIMRIKCHGYAEVVKNITIKTSSTEKLNVSLKKVFTPNYKIVTATETIVGVLQPSDSTPTVVAIETSNGVKRYVPRENIRSQEPIVDNLR